MVKLQVHHCLFHNEFILVVGCALSKHSDPYVVRNVSFVVAIEMLDTKLYRNDLSSSVVSDYSSSFTSEVLQNYLAQKEIEHHFRSPANNPSSNVQAEQSVGVIKNGLPQSVW